MIPIDLKNFRPSEEESPVVRLMDLAAFVAAAGLALAAWIIASAILGLA